MTVGVREVAAGIHRIEVSLGTRYVCSYAIVGDDATLLVDTAVASAWRPKVLPALERAGVLPDAVRLVVITHADYDHFGGNSGAVDALPRAVIACHRADRTMIEDVEALIRDRYDEFAEDHGIGMAPEERDAVRGDVGTAVVGRLIAEGDELDLGGRVLSVLELPGHSPGHIGLLDARTGAAIVGDAVMGQALPGGDGSPAFAPTYRDPAAYRASARRLVETGGELLLTGHYPVMSGAAFAGFLDETLAFADRLEDELRSAVRLRGHWTTKELIAHLASRVGAWPRSADDALAYPLIGHLEELQCEGVVRAGREAGGVVTWERSSPGA